MGIGPAHGKRGTTMARYELLDADHATLGQPAVTAAVSADMFFDLGMMYSTGRSVPADLVTAHKWFNISALRGNKEAFQLRREVAAEMSEEEIAAAQRAARDWLGRA
jgi:TPR repeat protein